MMIKYWAILSSEHHSNFQLTWLTKWWQALPCMAEWCIIIRDTRLPPVCTWAYSISQAIRKEQCKWQLINNASWATDLIDLALLIRSIEAVEKTAGRQTGIKLYAKQQSEEILQHVQIQTQVWISGRILLINPEMSLKFFRWPVIVSVTLTFMSYFFGGRNVTHHKYSF